MTDRDAGYREGIEAADEVRYWINDIKRGCGPTWYRNKLASFERIERLLRATLPSTPNDGKAEPVERNEIEHRLAMSMNDTLCEMIDNKEEMITTVITAKVIASKPFQQAIDKLASHPSPASDGALREALEQQARKVRNYSDPNDVFEAVPLRFIIEGSESALSAHAGDAAKESGGTELKLQPGWLANDVQKASEQVQEWSKPGPPDTHAEMKG